jgi:hypothetical protein
MARSESTPDTLLGFAHGAVSEAHYNYGRQVVGQPALYVHQGAGRTVNYDALHGLRHGRKVKHLARFQTRCFKNNLRFLVWFYF